MSFTHGTPQASQTRQGDPTETSVIDGGETLVSGFDLALWSSWCRRAASVFVVTKPADNVVALVLPAEMHQAKYFKAVLDQQWAQIDSEIAREYAAVADCQRRGDVRGLQRRRRQIARMLCQQCELDRLRAGLDRRFFARRGTPPKPARCFDIALARRGSWWSVCIPELAESIYARRRADAETMARACIAAIMGTSIAGIGVRVVSEPYESQRTHDLGTSIGLSWRPRKKLRLCCWHCTPRWLGTCGRSWPRFTSPLMPSGWGPWRCMWPSSSGVAIPIMYYLRRSTAISPKWGGYRSNP